MEKAEKKKVFLSYCSKDECIADMIDAAIQLQLGDFVQISRYTRDVGYRDSFRTFMDSIGEHDFVVAIVSDNYLKSEACMYEAGEIVKNRMMTKKLLFVILGEDDRKYYPPDYCGNIAANIYSKTGRAEYILFWQEKYDEFENTINRISRNERKVEMTKDLRLLSSIVDHDISPFMDYLSDANGIALGTMLKSDFNEILESIDPEYKIRNESEDYKLLYEMGAIIKDFSDNKENVDLKTLFSMIEVSQKLQEKSRKQNTISQIGKLHDMLVEAGIPHKYLDRFPGIGKQIVYFGHKGEPEKKPGVIYGAGYGAICSVIADGYGSKEGLLEISGLLTTEEYEKTRDSVLGYLSAENVFDRIKKHYESESFTESEE